MKDLHSLFEETVCVPELTSHVRRLIKRKAPNLPPESVEDVVQKVFLKAWRGFPKFRGDSKLKSWLHRITINATYDALRMVRDNRTMRIEDVKTDDGLPGEYLLVDTRDEANPYEFIRAREIREKLEHILRGFTPTQRKVFDLRFKQGMRYRAIAIAINRTEATAKNYVFRIRARLKAELVLFLQGSEVQNRNGTRTKGLNGNGHAQPSETDHFRSVISKSGSLRIAATRLGFQNMAAFIIKCKALGLADCLGELIVS